jgi:hypothetical protein
MQTGKFVWSFTGNVLSAGADIPGLSTPQMFAKANDTSNRAHLEDRNTGFVNWNASIHPGQVTRWMVTNPSPENFAKVCMGKFSSHS